MKKDVVDDLFSIVIKRYQNEKPDIVLSESMMDAIWFSLYGKLDHEGTKAAYDYARTGTLIG